MKTFDLKHWNDEVFEAYRSTIADPIKTNLMGANIFYEDQDLVAQFPAQAGGNYAVRLITGRLRGDADDLDGDTNISDGSLGTLSQGVVVITKGKSFTEKDFTYNLTGKDFMLQVAEQLVGYWSKQNQKTMLSILKGIFASALAGSVVSKVEVKAEDIIDAVRGVGGDNADMFKVVFMHSEIARRLEKQNLLTFVMQNDANGIQRPTNIAYWGSRLVIVNDACPVEATAPVYALTSDVAIVEGKTYYTRSGAEGAYIYTPVANPVEGSLSSYYEMTAKGHKDYTCYLLGENAFCYTPLPLLVKAEMVREAKVNGGQTSLVDRERFILAPEGLSFAKPTALKITNAVLETGANWSIVADSEGNAIDAKLVPFASLKYIIED